MTPGALIQDPFFVLATLAGIAALVFQVARVPALAKIFDRLPAMAPVGLLLAVLGNVIGTYAGLFVAQILSAIRS